MMWRLVFSCMALFYMVMTAMPQIVTSKTPIFRHNVLFVTAHPDDEVMFFGPTLRHALDLERNNSVQLLCLSSGNATGLGRLRVSELAQAANIVGLPPQNVTVIDSELLPDSMEAVWETDVVADVISKVVDQHNISIIITFDEFGVSGHLNHQAVYKGAKQVAESLWHDAERQALLMSLRSVPLARKYIFVIDTLFSRFWDTIMGYKMIVANQKDYHLIRQGMTSGHRSQMTWYRWAYVHFSRYLLINDLEIVHLDAYDVETPAPVEIVEPVAEHQEL